MKEIDRSRKEWEGIVQHGTGFRATVSQGRHLPQLRHWFPADTPPHVMQEWRRDEYARLRMERKNKRTKGRLDTDIRRYLDRPEIKSMPSFSERRNNLALWLEVLGPVDRSTITPFDVAAALERWTQQDSRRDKPYAASTLNHRLRHLSNLYRVLDGRMAYNPVREVAELPEPEPQAKDLDPADVWRMLASMPDRGQPKDGHRPAASKTKARLMVMAATGLPSGTLGKLRKADVDLKAQTMRLPTRGKGRGAPAVLVPLSAEAVKAFAAFDTLECWGKFSHQSLNKSLKRAAKRIGVEVEHGVYPYRLRHTFATQLAKRTGDEVAVSALLQHRDIKTTRKYYTTGSHFDRMKAAVGVHAGYTAPSTTGKKNAVSRSSTRPKKAAKVRRTQQKR